MKINLPKSRSPLWSIHARDSCARVLVTMLATTSILARSGQSVIAQQINCDRPQGDVEVRACIRFRYET